jgi:hypothetical protein
MDKVTVLTFIEFIFICTVFPLIVVAVMRIVAGVIS